MTHKSEWQSEIVELHPNGRLSDQAYARVLEALFDLADLLLLVAAGLDATSVEVTSHGEAVLLVRTPDETYEPRNRRVEITIR